MSVYGTEVTDKFRLEKQIRAHRQGCISHANIIRLNKVYDTMPAGTRVMTKYYDSFVYGTARKVHKPSPTINHRDNYTVIELDNGLGLLEANPLHTIIIGM